MSETDFQPLIEWLKNNPDWVLFATLLISFIESLALAGIIVPGVLMLFLVSAAAGHLNIAVELVLLAGFIGAILGDGVSFFLGHYFKDSLRTIWPFSRYPETLAFGERFFLKHGGKSVMLGRFIGPIRPVIPIVAGMLHMPHLRFTVFNALSALIWAPFYILPGYLAGNAIHVALPDSFYIALITLFAILCLISFGFRYASLNLQMGQPVYNRLGIARNPRFNNSTLEFPLASITLFTLTSLAFSLWSFLVLSTNQLTELDQSIQQLFVELRLASPFIDELISRIFIHLTLLGDEAFLYLSFATVVGLLVYLRQYRAAVFLVVTGLSTAAITHTLKDTFSILRPEVVMLTPNSYAYPSGHSSGSTVFYGLIAALIAQSLPNQQRWKCYLAFFIPMFLIAFSRVMLNVHWLSDIIGGILLGLALCGASRTLYAVHYLKDHERKRPRKEQLKALAVTLSIWILITIVYQAHMLPEAFIHYQLKPNMY